MSIGRVPGATGIQPSIVTAKGDLIVATASGSVTNQAVGSNNQVLMADSAQADGVKWANGSAATLTTTGDLLYASAANTPARLGIGSTSQVLTVSGGVPTWATASSGGITLITSSSVGTGTTVTFSNIFATSYKQLYLVGKNIYANGDNRTMSFAPLTEGDSVCDFSGMKMWVESTSTVSGEQFYAGSNKEFTKLPSSTGSPDTSLNFQMLIYAADLGSTNVGYNFQCIQGTYALGTQIIGKMMSGSGSAAINKLRFTTNGGNFASGNIYLYGIN